MKNLILVTSSFLLFLTSCETFSSNKLEKMSTMYKTVLPAVNGDGTELELEFWIDNVLVDSLNIPPDSIIHMCEVAIDKASYDCNYPLTYKHKPTQFPFLIFNEQENTIGVFMNGSAKNGFGVEKEITTFIEFNRYYQISKINFSDL